MLSISSTIWSRLVEQPAGNVILFGMNRGTGAQDTNPTQQQNFIFWCEVWMHKHKACHPKGTIQQHQDEDDSAAHNADETAGDRGDFGAVSAHNAGQALSLIHI